MSPWWSLCTLYLSHARWSYRRRLGSLLLWACIQCVVSVVQAQLLPIVCWFFLLCPKMWSGLKIIFVLSSVSCRLLCEVCISMSCFAFSIDWLAVLMGSGAVLKARDVVDGHREKTLAFLWKLIFHFQVQLSSLWFALAQHTFPCHLMLVSLYFTWTWSWLLRCIFVKHSSHVFCLFHGSI